jgi:hypothetical protein
MADRNAALDRDGEVWAQHEFGDVWRCLTNGGLGTVNYNTLVAERGPIDTVRPVTEKYRTVR